MANGNIEQIDDLEMRLALVEEKNRELEQRNKELERYCLPVRSQDKRMFSRRAVFLDRDGTLIDAIERPDFDKKITAPFYEEELRFAPDVYLSLEKLKDAGFLRIMVTNQPDVAHGYMEERVWRKIQKRVEDTLGLDDVYMCRHTAEDNCPFKKPSSLMLQAAADKWGIDLSRSYMVGDTCTDMEAGRAAGCRRVMMINRSYNIYDECDDVRSDSLKSAVEFILTDNF